MNQLIKQRYVGDCGVACLAMFCGISYEETMKLIKVRLGKKEPVNGLNNVEIAKILKVQNFDPCQVYTILKDTPAIISVPSLGNKKKFHYIYFDGKNIHDPSNFETYSNADFSRYMPMADSVVCMKSIKVDLPTHLFNCFDWGHINAN